MTFQRIDNAITVIRQHLVATGSQGTEIESNLVSYILVITYAEFEAKVKKILELKLASALNNSLHHLLPVISKSLYRGLKVSECSGILAHFDERCKLQFQQAVEGTPEKIAYDNIIANRHLIAHQSGTQITFAEVVAAVQNGCVIIEKFALSLGLSATEIANLS